MVTADLHLHTNFSTDCNNDPRDVIEQAIKCGLNTIGITDHMDIAWPEDNTQYIFDHNDYFKTLGELKEEYKDRIEILIAMEFGFRNEPNVVKTIDKHWKFYKELPFDYVLNSTHIVDNGDPYYVKFWEGHSVYERMVQYFEAVLYNARHYDGADIFAHLDYAGRYMPEGSRFEVTRYIDIIEEILKTIISKGCALELNTALLNKGYKTTNPDRVILKMYKELGGELITIGSDAHRLYFIGGYRDTAAEILKNAGFKYYAVYRQHKATMYEL